MYLLTWVLANSPTTIEENMVYYDVCKLVCAEESVQVSPQKLHNHRPISRVVEWLKTLCV